MVTLYYASDAFSMASHITLKEPNAESQVVQMAKAERESTECRGTSNASDKEPALQRSVGRKLFDRQHNPLLSA